MLPVLMVALFMSSCFHRDHVSITMSDTNDEFEMDASYRKNQARTVRVYLNDRLLNNADLAYKNGLHDQEITLEDNTTFYINTDPGELRIKIDKRENSAASCEHVKQVCADLEQILAED